MNSVKYFEKIYRKAVMKNLSGLRGFTRTHRYIKKLATARELIKEEDGYYTYLFENTKITLPKISDFYETVLRKSPLRGYISQQDIEKDDVVIDLGAAPGEFTVYAAKKAKNGTVIAFEADPAKRETLKETIKRNNLKNVEVRGKISSNKLERLDKEEINFIKCDIEGFETNLFLNSGNFLQKYSPHLAIASYHIEDGEKTWKKLEPFFKKQGYNTKADYPKHLTLYCDKNMEL